MTSLAYVGSYTWHTEATGRGITAYRRDGATLTPLGELATPAPSYLIADPRRPVIYAVNELAEGTVTSYAVDGAGGIEALSSQPTGGIEPCHLMLRGDELIVANYTSGSVAVLPVDADGVIGPHTDVVRHQGRGPNPERQDGPHAHFVHAGPGDQVTVVDLGLDRLLHFDLVDGRLSPAGETAAPAGSGPRHLVTHPGGAWYVTAELESAVLTFVRDPATGWLTHTTTGPATACTPDRPNQPSGLELSADGRRLYVANRGSNTIATFEVRVDGSLRAIGEVGSGGDWPRQLTLVDDLLFVTNQRSHCVASFRLDPATGLPEPTGEQVTVDAPASILVTG
jgi:6-phosphogluconolactonase